VSSPVTITNLHPRLRPAHKPLERVASRVFAGERKKGRADIILAGTELLHDLNRKFRKKNKTTDVLSFGFGAGGRPDASGFWGEIYINLDVLRDEAKKQHSTLRDGVARRVVHGLLHVFGYDHQRTAEATVMTAREERYLRAAGISGAGETTRTRRRVNR